MMLMIITCKDDFNQRVKEIQAYCDMLRVIENGLLRKIQPEFCDNVDQGQCATFGESFFSMSSTGTGVNVSVPAHGEMCSELKVFNNDYLKTLKATSYLLFYNLIESTIRNLINAINEEFKANKLSYKNSNMIIKKMIIERIKNMTQKEMKKTEQNDFLDEIFSDTFNRLDFNFSLSGNLDAKKIREISSSYGFSSRVNRLKTRDGSDLLTVKDKRNDLAHGHKSFSDVGREITSHDIEQTFFYTRAYLLEIINNVENFLKEKDYLERKS